MDQNYFWTQNFLTHSLAKRASPSVALPLQTIAAYFRLHWVIINKLQGKAVTRGEKLEWWITSMVDCVTIWLYTSVKWLDNPPLK